MVFLHTISCQVAVVGCPAATPLLLALLIAYVWRLVVFPFS